MNDDAESLLGPHALAVLKARKDLETANSQVVEMAGAVPNFGPMGTEELPVAIAAMESAEFVDEDEAAARWVSRAFTATPTDLLKTGAAGLALGGAIFMMRTALHALEQALAALDNKHGPTAPGGTFSA